MADHNIPHFQNDNGYKIIEIGVKEFMCVGATQPFDHPHIFIDMGAADEKICPYCSTLYRYNNLLQHDQTNPIGCAYHSDSSNVS
ncbi:zinc-finger domain-containing protein [Bartonella ancashensis]|uniref:zinc-finger domain-containing protein n=1 Tax=Bartonella ancashensis TaxID=1318743 RepID=UPI0006B4E6A5|nr:zinc-finger domain-containing protein [Bartonella ancashensis]